MAGVHALLALTLGVACGAPRDVTPQIHVAPGAAGRINWLAKPAPPNPKAAPARVHVMREGEELGGPNAIGRPGDLLLENDEVVFVIDRIGSSSGFAESGGNVVDAADAVARKDELGQQFTYFGKFPRQGVYDDPRERHRRRRQRLGRGEGPGALRAGPRRDDALHAPPARPRARARDDAREHRRRAGLRADAGRRDPVGRRREDRARQGARIQGPLERAVRRRRRAVHELRDHLHRRRDRRRQRQQRGPTPRSGTPRSEGTSRSRPARARSTPASSSSDERPDSASLVSELTRNAGQPVGAVDIRLVPADAPSEGDAGAPGVDVPPDARVSVRRPRRGESLTIHAAGTPPRLEALLPPGHYTLAYAGGGGRAGRAPADVDVVADGETHADLGGRASGGRARRVRRRRGRSDALQGDLRAHRRSAAARLRACPRRGARAEPGDDVRRRSSTCRWRGAPTGSRPRAGRSTRSPSPT